MTRTLRFCPLILLASLASGCYESSTPLSAPGHALDERLYGFWRCVPNDPKSSESAMLRIGAFDEHQYYADWVDEDNATHYRAYPTAVKSATLLNVQELHEKPVRGRWMFLRYELGSGNALTFSIAQDTLVTGATEAAKLEAVRRGATGAGVFGPATARCTRQQQGR